MQQIEFIHNLTFADLPPQVISSAKRVLLDLLAVAAAGSKTHATAIMLDFVCEQMPGDRPILFTGRHASSVGAALANATMIDSFDAHDGHVLCKGHVGVAVLPALCALYAEPQKVSRPQQQDYLTTIVLGYELGTRLGMALHKSACDYHTSGAWNAIAAAAIGARVLRLNAMQTRHALGIAEYHGPRSQMMRAIDYPTMLKDGSGIGAMSGVSAALLAQKGFTGAPAVTIENEEFRDLYASLGDTWLIQEQYFKRYAVCRWAQPAIEAALHIRLHHDINKILASGIKAIHVFTFHEAVRLGAVHPKCSEDVQYGLAFAFCCALLYGDISAQKVIEEFNDAKANALIDLVQLHEFEKYNALFPAQRFAHIEIELHNNEVIVSEPTRTKGDYDNPYSDAILKDKAANLLGLCMPSSKVRELMDFIEDFAS